MVTYYQGQAGRITHEVFEVACPQPHRYRIADLHGAYVVRGDRDPVAMRVLITATLTLMPVAVGWLFLGPAASWLAASALIVSPALMGPAWWRRHRREWVLRATYHRYQVDLFRCTDTRTFGQVKRALLRALEGCENQRSRRAVAYPRQAVYSGQPISM